jgi:hypothetical protein
MAFLCGGGSAGSSREAARQTAESDRDPTALSLGPLDLVHFHALLDMDRIAVK